MLPNLKKWIALQLGFCHPGSKHEWWTNSLIVVKNPEHGSLLALCHLLSCPSVARSTAFPAVARSTVFPAVARSTAFPAVAWSSAVFSIRGPVYGVYIRGLVYGVRFHTWPGLRRFHPSPDLRRFHSSPPPISNTWLTHLMMVKWAVCPVVYQHCIQLPHC